MKGFPAPPLSLRTFKTRPYGSENNADPARRITVLRSDAVLLQHRIDVLGDSLPCCRPPAGVSWAMQDLEAALLSDPNPAADPAAALTATVLTKVGELCELLLGIGVRAGLLLRDSGGGGQRPDGSEGPLAAPYREADDRNLMAHLTLPKPQPPASSVHAVLRLSDAILARCLVGVDAAGGVAAQIDAEAERRRCLSAVTDDCRRTVAELEARHAAALTVLGEAHAQEVAALEGPLRDLQARDPSHQRAVERATKDLSRDLAQAADENAQLRRDIEGLRQVLAEAEHAAFGEGLSPEWFRSALGVEIPIPIGADAIVSQLHAGPPVSTPPEKNLRSRRAEDGETRLAACRAALARQHNALIQVQTVVQTLIRDHTEQSAAWQREEEFLRLRLDAAVRERLHVEAEVDRQVAEERQEAEALRREVTRLRAEKAAQWRRAEEGEDPQKLVGD